MFGGCGFLFGCCYVCLFVIVLLLLYVFVCNCYMSDCSFTCACVLIVFGLLDDFMPNTARRPSGSTSDTFCARGQRNAVQLPAKP